MTERLPTPHDIHQERENLEAFLWGQTEWRGSADTMAKILDAIDHYADLRAGIPGLLEARTAQLRGDAPLPRSTELSITDPVTGHVFVWGAPTAPGQTQCRACFRVQPDTAFGRDKDAKSGRLPRCKTCVRERCYIKAGAV